MDFTKRFKVATDVLVSHIGGPIVLTKTVGKITDNMFILGDTEDEKREYRTQQVEKVMKGEHDKLITLIYLENTDQEKYGSLVKNLKQQYSLKNNQFQSSN